MKHTCTMTETNSRATTRHTSRRTQTFLDTTGRSFRTHGPAFSAKEYATSPASATATG